ncbi:MAG: hypothetical protein ACK4IX_18340 [Candidatus Sericytochromatia bacterium]
MKNSQNNKPSLPSGKYFNLTYVNGKIKNIPKKPSIKNIEQTKKVNKDNDDHLDIKLIKDL